ncbi:MAG: hypothetical protein J5525_03010 [Lachnospiraceae bacterium]|nr:hypothetical protein [Lachnospiraceae bacterium]
MFIKLAEKIIEIRNIYPYIEEYCKEYIVSNNLNLDLSVMITQKDIDFEREKSRNEDIVEGREIREFKDDYLETLAVYRKIAEWMPKVDTILFHGSVIAMDGKGYLFTAKSGTGKSTHARLWRDLYGNRVIMINDDKPLIHVESDMITAYGTPWDGKHRFSTNTSVPLTGICVLHRSKDNRIERVTGKEVYPMFVQQTYRPSQKESMSKTFDLLDQMLEQVPVYNLYCNMDIDAARVAYEGMNRE